MALGLEMWIQQAVEVLSFLMLITGVFLSISRTVLQMLPNYQAQCLLLAVITLLTAFELWRDSARMIIVALFVLVPVGLAFLVEPLLAQATVQEDVPVWKRLPRAFNLSIRAKTRHAAVPAWLRSRRAMHSVMWYLVIDLFLIALAYVTAYTLVSSGPTGAGQAGASISPHVLAVAFSLLLIGLWTMMGTEDLISQVIGLLVMEQGMFLAVVRAFILSLAPRTFSVNIIFVIALFLYISITLVILVLLLPELHQKTGSLDIEQQTQLKG